MIEEGKIKEEYLQPMLLDGRNIFHHLALNPKFLGSILNILSENVGEALPLLFFKDKADQTPLDIAVENNQILSIVIILKAILTLYNEPIYNYMVDKNLIKLFSLNVDLN